MESPRTDESGRSPSASDETSSPPSPDQPRKGLLVVVSGPSGVGKNSILEPVLRDWPAHFSVSMTTRAARPGEREGVDRFFVDHGAFRAAIDAGEMLEWTLYNDHLYGTPAGPVLEQLGRGENVLLEIEVDGAGQVKAAYPDAVLIFISPPSLEALATRLAGRGDTTDIADRLEIARREMEAAEGLFDHVVVNDVLNDAVAEVLGILRASEETISR